MTGRSHLAIGTLTAVAGTTIAASPPGTAAAVIAAAIATAKLPDIDLQLPIRHRGATHTLLACIALTALAALLLAQNSQTGPYAWAAALGVLAGYGMHLVADACTPHGVPAFAPLVRRDVHLLPRALRIVTGSWSEAAVVTLYAVGTLYLAFHAYT